MITTKNLTLNFDSSPKPIINNLNINIDQKVNTCLVGVNGQGKSTLAKLLASLVKADSGTINTEGLIIKYYNQDSINEITNYDTIIDYLLSVYDNYWEIEDVLQKSFGFEIEYDKLTSTLSQGQKQLISLVANITYAKINNQYLILDEPTNHLDMGIIDKLKNILILNKTLERKGDRKLSDLGVLIITHDLELINNVSDQILEIENGIVTSFSGNYDDFIKQKERLEEIRIGKVENLVKELKKQESKLNIIKNSDAAKNYKSSDNDKCAKTKKIESADKNKSSLIKQISKQKESTNSELSTLNKPIKYQARFGIDNTEKSKFMIVTLEDGCVKIKDDDHNKKNLLQNINLSIHNPQKISLQGTNGSGKTLLLNFLFGLNNINNQVEFSFSNKKIKEKVKIGYFDQNYINQLDVNKSVYDNFILIHSDLDETKLRKSLANMLFFKGNDIHKLVKYLSGGEKVRLALAIITAKPIDILVLDEPDNNLDIPTKNILTQAINTFNNSIIIITHDKYFINQLEIDSIWEIVNGEVRITCNKNISITTKPKITNDN
jgi:ATPase subunit of ABC transporter with duplicated ATPase domains